MHVPDSFEGSFHLSDEIDSIRDASGVYIILTNSNYNGYDVVDVGQSGELNTRLSYHNRDDCWEKHNNGGIYVIVHYTDEYSRKKMERELRQEYDPPCGKR